MEPDIIINGHPPLVRTPKGTYTVGQVEWLTPEDALQDYNLLNHTSLTEMDLRAFFFERSHKTSNTEINFPKLIGNFESKSEPGNYHKVFQNQDGSLVCSCYGSRAPNKCWHIRGTQELIRTNSLPEKLPFTIKLKKE